MLLPQPILSRRVRAPQVVVPDEICPDLRGCGDAATLVSVQPRRTLPLVPLPAPAPLPVLFLFLALFLAAVSTGGATRLLASRLELGLQLGPELPRERPAHHHRISAARARAPWLLPWWTRLRAFCGASSARSSIYAYTALVAHPRIPEQSPTGGSWGTRARPSKSRVHIAARAAPFVNCHPKYELSS
jgi:hypothetical protein